MNVNICVIETCTDIPECMFLGRLNNEDMIDDILMEEDNEDAMSEHVLIWTYE